MGAEQIGYILSTEIFPIVVGSLLGWYFIKKFIEKRKLKQINNIQ